MYKTQQYSYYYHKDNIYSLIFIKQAKCSQTIYPVFLDQSVPFIDPDDLLRVDSHLNLSSISENTKYAILQVILILLNY